jgi:hypothetical protein
MFFGHGSLRTPGAVGLENIKVNLPVVSPSAKKAKRKKAARKRRRAARRHRRR